MWRPVNFTAWRCVGGVPDAGIKARKVKRVKGTGMGRRSVAAEKRVQIVEAFCDCVIDLGIDKASMGEVASRVGIDRSTMHYYFKAREDLVVEASNHIAGFYVTRIQEAVAALDVTSRARSLVELLFGPNFHDPRRSVLLDEFSTLGNRQPLFQDQIKTIYAAMEDSVMEVFRESLPNVPDKARKDLVYTLMALCEGTTVFMALGLPKAQRLATRRAALQLLSQIESGDTGDDD